MNILVTGATGFIGKRFLEMSKEYLHQDDEVILLTSKEIEGYKCILHKNYTYAIQDFVDLGIEKIDKVIHIGHFLAENHKNDAVVKGNLSSIENTKYLLEHLPNKPKSFVFCSTMGVYGENVPYLVDEESQLLASTPYATSKIFIEMLLKEWAEENKVLLHILRLAHIYGPEDTRRYTIPIWLQAARQKQSIKLFANPQMLRNCLYKDDCCRFMWKALYLEDDVKIINVVSEHTSTMLEIAEMCKEVSGNTNEIQIDLSKCNIEQETGLGFKNNEICRKYLGEEQYNLRSGLKEEYKYFY